MSEYFGIRTIEELIDDAKKNHIVDTLCRGSLFPARIYWEDPNDEYDPYDYI